MLMLLPSTVSYCSAIGALGSFWILPTLPSLQKSSPVSHLDTVCIRQTKGASGILASLGAKTKSVILMS